MLIKITTSAWMSRGIPFRRDGDSMRFMIPKRTEVIRARVVDGMLAVFPQRSADHRALLEALGEL
jgi:hypothetical protein